MISSEVWLAYGVANAIGVAFLIIAVRSAVAARWMFFLLFAWASATNVVTSRRSPAVYLEYADYSPLYREFILGPFSERIPEWVGAIAVGQALIALSMLIGGWGMKAGAVGAIVFLLAIAPLGIAAGFPFSLTVSAAALLVILRAPRCPLWSRVPRPPQLTRWAGLSSLSTPTKSRLVSAGSDDIL